MTAARTRERIVEAAAGLLAAGGPEAMTTRAVSAAAGVQAPAIYRLFDDKHGLLDAVTSHVFAGYLHSKASLPRSEDPVEDLRRGWDLHVGFGLAHPAVYAAIYGSPRPGAETPAERQAAEILAGLVHRIARVGRLALTEQAAAQLVHATGRGTTLTLIGLPPDRRDPEFAPLARESVIAAVTTPTDTTAGRPATAGTTTGRPTPAAAAVTLRALLPEVTDLTEAERHLMTEWLDRIATH